MLYNENFASMLRCIILPNLLPPTSAAMSPIHSFALAIVLLLANSVGLAQETAISDEEIRFFERKVRPVLVEHCYGCHSRQAKVLHGGLRLDDAAGWRKGGDSGPLLVAGAPESSLLIQSIRYDGELQMPPKGKLTEAEIGQLTEWVARGAHLPAQFAPEQTMTEQAEAELPQSKVDIESGRTFWSFQPARLQPLPQIQSTQWARNRIDQFVMAGMEKAALHPARPADPTTLVRRLVFDLTGLPPTPEQVQAFVTNPSPAVYDALLEQLLASGRYGEKWARVWLDLARYTDQTESWLLQEGQAHYYRDWVVDAFNNDIPYDEFITRQLAVDLLPGTTPEDLAALGFVGLSPTYWKELQLPCEVIKVIVADEWEERVDAVCSTFLGLTVACARCHDHKFDPIRSADYYAIAGVFASSRQVGRPLVPEDQYQPVRVAKEEIAKLEPELAKLKSQIAKRKQERDKQATNAKSTGGSAVVPTTVTAELTAEDVELQKKYDDTARRIAELKATPLYDAPLVNALSEESLYVERAGAKPQDGTRLVYRPGAQDLPLFSRGDPNRPGELVPRSFLSVLSPDGRPFRYGSGRLELAESITSQAASLAARVMVNRIWLAHFGQGLVTTPSNFGTQGARPSHPELLDDLTARFMANGWSIKWLHREILRSVTWQQSVVGSHAAELKDPSNQWLSHANRRRHDFEAWRDSMLVASGLMEVAHGGPASPLDALGNHRRTLYCTVHRRELSTTFQIHDFPDPNQHSPQRFSTTTALQGLYALNGPLLTEQSQALAARLEFEHPKDEAARIDRAHWLLFSRPATADERSLALAYLADATGDERRLRWQQYAHALLASSEALFLD